MDRPRNPLPKVEGRRRMRLSGVTVAWRGTPRLDDWVAYIVDGTRSKKLILANHASELKVKTLMSRLQTLSCEEIETLAANASATVAMPPRMRSVSHKEIENPARFPRTTAFTREVIRIHQQGGLSDRLIARATGATLSTVRDWLASCEQPTGVRAERVAELGAIVERLARVIEPGYIPVWLIKPIAALGDEKPIDALRRGHCVRVARLVSGLEDSGAA